jgi:hypothetical protein
MSQCPSRSPKTGRLCVEPEDPHPGEHWAKPPPPDDTWHNDNPLDPARDRQRLRDQEREAVAAAKRGRAVMRQMERFPPMTQEGRFDNPVQRAGARRALLDSGTDRAKVLIVIEDAGRERGATFTEMEAALTARFPKPPSKKPWKYGTVAPRVRDLKGYKGLPVFVWEKFEADGVTLATRDGEQVYVALDD